jgi:hypothetical protein
MATTVFAFGPQLLKFSTDFQNKTCFGNTIILAIPIHLLDDFYLQTGGIIQDGVFQTFYVLLQHQKSSILNY